MDGLQIFVKLNRRITNGDFCYRSGRRRLGEVLLEIKSRKFLDVFKKCRCIEGYLPKLVDIALSTVHYAPALKSEDDRLLAR